METEKALEIVNGISYHAEILTDEQKEAIRTAMESIREIVEKLAAAIREAAAVILAAWQDIWAEYAKRRPYTGRYARKQKEYWFAWAIHRHLLIE